MSLRHALLGALADQPRTGYALLKHFEQSFAYAWPASHSQIYPEPARLLEGGPLAPAGVGRRHAASTRARERAARRRARYRNAVSRISAAGCARASLIAACAAMPRCER